MRRYCIAIMVPAPLHATLAELRQRYDTYSRQWLPPHITIVPPFELTMSDAEVTRIRELPLSTEVKLGALGAIRRTYTSVLYVEARGELAAVRDVLLKAIPRLRPFIRPEPAFHITLVSRIPNDQFEPLRQVLDPKRPTGSFTAERLALFAWDAGKHGWVEAERGEAEALVDPLELP